MYKALIRMKNSVLEKPQSNERKHGRYTSLVFKNFYKMRKQKLMSGFSQSTAFQGLLSDYNR